MGSWNRYWGIPRESWEGGAGRGELRGGDEEGYPSAGRQKGGGYWERDDEAVDGADGHYIKGGWGKSFGAGVLYIDVRQCKGAGDFAEEGGFLLIGFD